MEATYKNTSEHGMLRFKITTMEGCCGVSYVHHVCMDSKGGGYMRDGKARTAIQKEFADVIAGDYKRCVSSFDYTPPSALVSSVNYDAFLRLNRCQIQIMDAVNGENGGDYASAYSALKDDVRFQKVGGTTYNPNSGNRIQQFTCDKNGHNGSLETEEPE